MKRLINKADDAMKLFIAIFILCGWIYACYWIAKNVSYFVFYEDMVEQTIKDTVKQEALK